MTATSRRWILTAALCAWGVGAPAAVPPDFAETYDALAGLFDQAELSPLDMARGSYDAANFFSVGKPGLPYAQDRFLRAKTQGEAGVGGLFAAVHGGSEDLKTMQRDLETNPRKRAWLVESVGTQDAFFASIESGANLKELLRVLPSTEGPRRFSIGCMQSSDALVRRAGLYWGYWFTGPAYWNEVKKIASADGDPVTRRIAARLMNPRTSKPEPN